MDRDEDRWLPLQYHLMAEPAMHVQRQTPSILFFAQLTKRDLKRRLNAPHLSPALDRTERQQNEFCRQRGHRVRSLSG